MLSDSRIRTISADQDMAIIRGAIRTAGHNASAVFIVRDDLLAEVDVLPGDLLPQEVVQVWSRNDVVAVMGSNVTHLVSRGAGNTDTFFFFVNSALQFFQPGTFDCKLGLEFVVEHLEFCRVLADVDEVVIDPKLSKERSDASS